LWGFSARSASSSSCTVNARLRSSPSALRSVSLRRELAGFADAKDTHYAGAPLPRTRVNVKDINTACACRDAAALSWHFHVRCINAARARHSNSPRTGRHRSATGQDSYRYVDFGLYHRQRGTCPTCGRTPITATCAGRRGQDRLRVRHQSSRCWRNFPRDQRSFPGSVPPRAPLHDRDRRTTGLVKSIVGHSD
jgi:hypothetical protein